MKVLVAFPSKYRFTIGIADLIAKKLKVEGTEAEVLQVDLVLNPSRFDTFIIWSAV